MTSSQPWMAWESMSLPLLPERHGGHALRHHRDFRIALGEADELQRRRRFATGRGIGGAHAERPIGIELEGDGDAHFAAQRHAKPRELDLAEIRVDPEARVFP